MKKCKYYKPYMDTLRKIVGGYYSLKDCCCGGPLHILLDDDNYGINHVHWCMEECFRGLEEYDTFQDTRDYSKEVYILGLMICNEYAKMSLEERAVFDSYMTGRVLDCCGDCKNCDLLGELYEWAKKGEEHAKTRK